MRCRAWQHRRGVEMNGKMRNWSTLAVVALLLLPSIFYLLCTYSVRVCERYAGADGLGGLSRVLHLIIDASDL